MAEVETCLVRNPRGRGSQPEQLRQNALGQPVVSARALVLTLAVNKLFIPRELIMAPKFSEVLRSVGNV